MPHSAAKRALSLSLSAILSPLPRSVTLFSLSHSVTASAQCVALFTCLISLLRFAAVFLLTLLTARWCLCVHQYLPCASSLSLAHMQFNCFSTAAAMGFHFISFFACLFSFPFFSFSPSSYSLPVDYFPKINFLFSLSLGNFKWLPPYPGTQLPA